MASDWGERLGEGEVGEEMERGVFIPAGREARCAIVAKRRGQEKNVAVLYKRGGQSNT
jgi:hypothetical protein